MKKNMVITREIIGKPLAKNKDVDCLVFSPEAWTEFTCAAERWAGGDGMMYFAALQLICAEPVPEKFKEHSGKYLLELDDSGENLNLFKSMAEYGSKRFRTLVKGLNL